MARTLTNTHVEQHIVTDEETPGLPAMKRAVDLQAVAHQQSQENALVVAEQLGYEGELSIGALEDGVRFYQQCSVEACLQLGKRLLLLKEITPHGEFIQRIEILGFKDRMARKFMAAALKFSKRPLTAVLKAAGNQTKMLELLMLEDGELEALESGETVRGIDLNKLENMGLMELRQAYRESKAEHESKDRIIEAKDAKLNEMDIKLGLEQQPVAIPGQQELADLQTLSQNIAGEITAGLHSAYVKLCTAHGDHAPESVRLVMGQSLGLVVTEAYELGKLLNITPVEQAETAVKYGPKADAEDYLAWKAEQDSAENEQGN